MILITSSAYVDSEFRIEFGLLPPAFLPVGNQRLFERQLESLSCYFPAEDILISLPSSYQVGVKDNALLEKYGVKIIYIDDNLTLPNAILEAIHKTSGEMNGFRILHGDTLLNKFPVELDVVGIAITREDYQWEVESLSAEFESVWCGYFSFSDIGLLSECLASNPNSFSSAVKKYDEIKSLKKVNIDSWSDFGHINTYFQSRSRITTQRSFNSLKITDATVRKSGQYENKILAESAWFKHLPAELRIFCPQLIDDGFDQNKKPYYMLEYLPLPPLNEVYVHGKNQPFYWEKIFLLCNEFFGRCSEVILSPRDQSAAALDFLELIEGKTSSRLNEFFQQFEVGWDSELVINGQSVPSLDFIFKDCVARSKSLPRVPAVMHGDFCLSNILFDSRIDRIKVIDPRGLNAFGEYCNFGDLAYDLAKLTHSIIGLYDFIIAGAFDLNYKLESGNAQFNISIFCDDRIHSIQERFKDSVMVKMLRPLDVMPLTILLFLSMLPLHADNPKRQLAFLANALYLYDNYINK
jgi:hypothetical protein